MRYALSLPASLAVMLSLIACTPGAQTPDTSGTPTNTETTGTKTTGPGHVIVVSVDGLMPVSYLDPDKHGLRVPTLREMKQNGAYATAARSVFPSVTYPSHTTMATGVPPRTHGVVSNHTFDPTLVNDEGWFWYTEDIRVPTIWQVAEQAGLITALVDWPVTVGAKVDFLVPEYWRKGTADDQKLARALSTPGLLDRVADRFPDFWKRFTPPDVRDQAGIDIAVHLIETEAPELLMVHIWDVDSAEHDHGVWTDEAKAAIEGADAQIARLIEAAKNKGIWERTTLFVVSDHGFLPITERVRLGVLLRERGLVTLDDTGQKVKDWRAGVQADGGIIYVYLKDPGDTEAARMVTEIVTEYAARPDTKAARVYSRDDIAARGGDERAFLALEAKPGFAFKDGYVGDLMATTSSKGHHGFDPERPELQASLLVYGPRVGRAQLGQVRLLDIAPTVAHWLGLAMPDLTSLTPAPAQRGKVLEIPRAR